jgi:hypothetical protein
METMQPKVATVSKLVGEPSAGGILTRGVRTMGCSTANITAIALGGLDIYWSVFRMTIHLSAELRMLYPSQGQWLLAVGCLVSKPQGNHLT